MRYVRLGLLALGMVLLAVLVAQHDPVAIAASVGQLGWRLLVVIAFPNTLVVLFDTLGWRFAFLRDGVAFSTLVSVRLAGEAFNVTTPTASMGGEAVKAWMLAGHAPADESLSSVIAAKTTITVAQGLFLLLGIALAWWTPLLGSPLFYGMEWLLALEVLSLAAFILAQIRGVLGWGGRLLGRLGLARALDGVDLLARVDHSLAQFYLARPGRLTLSIVFHLVAWLLGIVETYLILHFLGLEVSWLTATVIEAFGTAIRVATFLIPASVGVLEGGYVATFAALGLGSASGLSFSLVRRVREVVWVGIGLAALTAVRPAAQPAGRRTA